MKQKPLSPELDKVELVPEAWERFEKAVRTAVKSGPHHQTVKKVAPRARKPRGGERA